jgi:hypothetical protein
MRRVIQLHPTWGEFEVIGHTFRRVNSRNEESLTFQPDGRAAVVDPRVGRIAAWAIDSGGQLVVTDPGGFGTMRLKKVRTAGDVYEIEADGRPDVYVRDWP